MTSEQNSLLIDIGGSEEKIPVLLIKSRTYNVLVTSPHDIFLSLWKYSVPYDEARLYQLLLKTESLDTAVLEL